MTWESFARVLLAIAPPSLLRSDVLTFMQAQTESDQNLIDYREFVISGKVMVLERQDTSAANLHVRGWLERQKNYSGDSSTYTWKNHVQWYQSRKSKAIVWLMRRSARAIRHAVQLEAAEKFLRHEGKRATALMFLGNFTYY